MSSRSTRPTSPRRHRASPTRSPASRTRRERLLQYRQSRQRLLARGDADAQITEDIVVHRHTGRTDDQVLPHEGGILISTELRQYLRRQIGADVWRNLAVHHALDTNI